jgi:hypothetical protein
LATARLKVIAVGANKQGDVEDLSWAILFQVICRRSLRIGLAETEFPSQW